MPELGVDIYTHIRLKKEQAEIICGYVIDEKET